MLGFESAYDAARAVYDSEPCARTFEEDLALHLRFGYVFSTPDAFIMGRAVNRNAPYQDILSPWVAQSSPDAWLVWLASGSGALALFMEREPFPMPFIGWERDNKLRWYRRQDLIRHVARTIPRGDAVLQRPVHAEAAASSAAAFAIAGC